MFKRDKLDTIILVFLLTAGLSLGTTVTLFYNKNRLLSNEIRIPQSIEDGKQMQELAERIRNLDEGEKLTLKINSYGGSSAATLEVINAMEASKGYIIAIVDPGAFSAGAYLALYADEVQGEAIAVLMFHTARLQNGTVLSEGQDAVTDIVASKFKTKLEKYFTAEELDNVFVGGLDLAITVEDFNKRGKGDFETTKVFFSGEDQRKEKEKEDESPIFIPFTIE